MNPLTMVTVALLRFFFLAEGQMCDRINHLSNYQRHICLTRPHVFQMLINGLITGHKGCTEALSDQVWNCSQSLMTRSSYINYGVKEGTPEAALVSAMKTAGMTYTYAKACVAGKLADCECMALNQDHPEALPQEIWSWAGCLESLIQARREVYHFVYSWADPGQTPKRRFMDVHNEVVGTQVQYNLVTRQPERCKCHGVSGSCTVRTCWTGLSEGFGAVAQELKSKYQRIRKFRSVDHCRPEESGCEDQYEPEDEGGDLSVEELIYLEPSKDYCLQYSQRGRLCANHEDFDHCENVCCGKFETQIERKSDKCNFRTEGCCIVAFDMCSLTEKRSYCL